LVSCGHLICPACHEGALDRDLLMEGVRCQVCKDISDYAIASASAGKLLDLLKDIEKDLK
jgi:uncharacterized protein (DUF983 family)